MNPSDTEEEEDLRPEYDFSGGVRGKYIDRLAGGANVVILEKDVAEFFPDSESVNEALRALAAIIRSQRAKSA
jgi:hypothetical protein